MEELDQLVCHLPVEKDRLVGKLSQRRSYFFFFYWHCQILQMKPMSNYRHLSQRYQRYSITKQFLILKSSREFRKKIHLLAIFTSISHGRPLFLCGMECFTYTHSLIVSCFECKTYCFLNLESVNQLQGM